jgi:hypothetical protein
MQKCTVRKNQFMYFRHDDCKTRYIMDSVFKKRRLYLKTETAMKYTHLKTEEIILAETASHLRVSSKIKPS